MIHEIKDGGTFLLNTSWTEEELAEKLPGDVKQYIARHNVQFYIVDANRLARELGLGNHANMILQAAFFKLSGVMPVEDAVRHMKEAVQKTYAKKGEKVDTYGGMARHGGGAFSGKDCTKVDRSAAYAARYAAKNIVAAGLAKKCEIQLSYAIGVAQPTSIAVDTFGTGKLSDTKLVEILRENFDFRPAGIIKMLDLRRPIYKQTAAYGHFGRNDLDLPWEKLDKVEDLKKYL